MIERKYSAIGICAILLLSVTLIPKSAHTDNGRADDDSPVRLFAIASEGPIGLIAGSGLNRRDFLINGRTVGDQQKIWAGDMLQSRAEQGIPVSIDSVGEVMLTKGAMVRLSTRYTWSKNNKKRTVLIASLLCGSISITLQHGSCAYLQAGGAKFTSSEGAVFDADIREGKALITLKSGRVSPEVQAEQHQYNIAPVGHGMNIDVPVGSLQQIKVQVTENDKPVSDVGVLFTLDPSGISLGRLGLGTLAGNSITIVTNADGIASVPFTAGSSKGTGAISATVEGTRASWTGQIRVTSKSITTSRSALWTIIGLVGAGAAAGITYALTRDRDSIQVQSPEVKKP